MDRIHVPQVFIEFRYSCVDVPYLARMSPFSSVNVLTYVDLQIRRVPRLHGNCVYIRLRPNSKLPSTASTKIKQAVDVINFITRLTWNPSHELNFQPEV